MKKKIMLLAFVATLLLTFGILKLWLSVRRTGEQESFLWRTPDAGCYRGAQSPERFAESQRLGRLLVLNDQVAHLYPTPTVSGNNNKAGARSMLSGKLVHHIDQVLLLDGLGQKFRASRINGLLPVLLKRVSGQSDDGGLILSFLLFPHKLQLPR